MNPYLPLLSKEGTLQPALRTGRRDQTGQLGKAPNIYIYSPTIQVIATLPNIV